MSTRKVYTVTEINQAAGHSLEERFGVVSIEGEVSGLSTPGSGHIYFGLMDQFSQIRCAFFRGYQRGSKTPKQNGEKIIATGNLAIYAQRGSYQLIVHNVELAGEGDLWRQFEKVKEDLKRRGYFEPENKKPIPINPRCVGVITSNTGAAVQDIIRTFRRRLPTTKLIIYPTLVQGDFAAKMIADTIRLADQRREVQAIILGRGGGSLEDLWAFNEVSVAEATFNCRIPIVTGIGHEPDMTIADMVSDYRASTPTAAAEKLTTPSMAQILTEFHDSDRQLKKLIQNRLLNLSQRVDYVERGLKHPKEQIKLLQDKFKHAEKHLPLLINKQLQVYRASCSMLDNLLARSTPSTEIERSKSRIDNYQSDISRCFDHQLKELQSRVASLQSRIETVNPSTTLKRGYAIVRTKENNSVVRDSSSVAIGQKLTAQLHAGTLHVEVEQTE